jgi:Rieske Fe-S protein
VVEVMELGAIPVGGVKLFRYPTEDDQAMLIRLGEDEYVAYSQKCTHLSCPVHFSPESGQIECPCHHGSFEARTGKVLAGPPPRPLPRIRLRISDGKIFAEEILAS